MPLRPKSFMPSLVEQIFSRYSKKFDEERLVNTFTSRSYTELLYELDSIFGDVLKLALRILDEQKITLYTTDKALCEIADITEGRNALRAVKLFSNVNYCQCPYFVNNVLRIPNNFASNILCSTTASAENGRYTCQHVLAVRLAKLLQASCIRTEVVAEHVFSFLLKQINPSDSTTDGNILNTIADHMN